MILGRTMKVMVVKLRTSKERRSWSARSENVLTRVTHKQLRIYIPLYLPSEIEIPSIRFKRCTEQHYIYIEFDIETRYTLHSRQPSVTLVILHHYQRFLVLFSLPT